MEVPAAGLTGSGPAALAAETSALAGAGAAAGAAAAPAPAPPIAEQAFDGLELEVRRVGRDRRAAPDAANIDTEHMRPEHIDEETA